VEFETAAYSTLDLNLTPLKLSRRIKAERYTVLISCSAHFYFFLDGRAESGWAVCANA
jgi:hypothetical protein